MISREEAFELLKTTTTEDHMINHALETEAVMRGLAKKLGKDVDLWGITGLLHDYDFSATKETPEKHGLESMPEHLASRDMSRLHSTAALFDPGQVTARASIDVEKFLDKSMKSISRIASRINRLNCWLTTAT